tara:strand:- start:215 stop:532 length:318 start_codon:yes stop_codon:yes gene_type:complete
MYSLEKKAQYLDRYRAERFDFCLRRDRALPVFFVFLGSDLRNTGQTLVATSQLKQNPFASFLRIFSSSPNHVMVPNFSMSNRMFSTSFTRQTLVAGLTVHERLPS